MPTPTEQVSDLTDEDVSATVTAFDLGRECGRASRAADFGRGLAVGISLYARIAAGDEDLIEQIRRLVDA